MKVSVVIPLFNAAHSLERAVESVIGTGYSDLEILIVDDGSSDNGLSVAHKLQAAHPEVIKVLQHTGGVNKGAGASRNLGIQSATGQVVSFLDADDWYLENRFEQSVKMLTEDPNVEGIYEPCRVIYDSGSNRQDFFGFEVIDVEGGEQKSLLEKVMFRPWHTPCITVRKDVFEKTGIFNEKLRIGQDWELWLRMAMVLILKKGGDEPVAVYRRWNGNRFHAGIARQSSQQVLCAALHWITAKQGTEQHARALRNALFDTSFGRADLELRERHLLRSKQLLYRLFRCSPDVALKKQFWGNVLKLRA